MFNEQRVIVPTIESLMSLISNFKEYKIDLNLDPEIEFGVVSNNEQSGFHCMMTQDYSLFSIDILNAKDEILIRILAEMLDRYNLETDRLTEDIRDCYNNRIAEMQTDYERYWVIYRFDEEDDMVLVRYRAFITE
ncbi:hypothetical protein [Paenibacillus aceris]|uniref:Uncharacterized protein n=1 Tax=Paenibacillus aceris TaxID=869555 RepID=A0ABS4HQE0_9BACL|nr:hypothetical protein [Paenibacillus aceris]MBP1960829.1 hypothetical protein [Paenibacillus aceris]NHW35493.1 hypothetical protein [Paenibacillus aceris]